MDDVADRDAPALDQTRNVQGQTREQYIVEMRANDRERPRRVIQRLPVDDADEAERSER